jgi:hypothetical protein
VSAASADFTGSGAWTAISGNYSAPASNAKTRFVQAKQNLYFTSSAGVYKMDSITATPAKSGAYKGLDIQLTVANVTGNWLADDYRTAYRVVWGYRDANDNLLLGAPSARAAVTNTDGATRAVTVRATIPSGATTSWFYQVYRAAAADNTSATVEPSDEMGLIYEANPSSTDISNKYVEFNDITPDELRGATLYTAGTQEGIAAGNEQPPMAKDICNYKNRMVYANTTSKHRYYLTLLSADGTNGLADADVLVIGGIAYVAGATETITSAAYKRYTAGSAAQNVRDTAESLCRVINRYANSTVYAYYLSGPDDLPGKMLIEERSIGGSAHYVGVTDASCWSPAGIPVVKTVTSVDTGTDTITSAAHGFSDADAIVFGKANGAVLPSGLTAGTVYYVRDQATNTYKVAATSGGSAIDLGSGLSGSVYAHRTTEASTNDRFKNAIYWSKDSQPEAVPLTNYAFCGSADAEILRVVPLRDSVFVFKEDGIYRFSGESDSSFRVDLFDSTTRLLAPDTAVPLNNQIYCLTDQGVVSVSESGVQVKSRPIENTITAAYGANPSVLQTDAFGISYETERKYILFLPRISADTAPSQAFVYNTFTNTWVRWVLASTAGVVNAADDKLYLADASSEYVMQERKARTFQDYADYRISATISAVSGTTLTITNTDSIEAGDVVHQSSSVYSTVTSVDSVAGTLTIVADNGFAAGSVRIYKPIESKIAWVPITAGNPGSMKHYRELSLLFRSDFSGSATVNFSSDVSPAQEAETVSGTTLGVWGLFEWDDVAWGGENVRRPIRMLVPRNHQRCTMLVVEFEHDTAFAPYTLSGASLVGRLIGERVAI